MNNAISVYSVTGVAGRRLFALIIFLAWACVVSFLAWSHVVFRDEVRALSLALQGDDVVSMLRGLHGEGHPAVWYLLLRGAHALIPRPEILQVVSLIVAFTSILLLVLRSPFGLLLIALLLSSRFALFEYSVMARNYGISMLLLFLLAWLYERHRDRGILLGTLLFLLANCNAHSVLLVGAFLVFWFFDIIRNHEAARPPALRTFFLNAAIATLGIALCALTVFPPFNDAAQIDRHLRFTLLLKAVFLPEASFGELARLPSLVMQTFSLWREPWIGILKALFSLLIFGSTLGLVRRPAALLAAWAALIGFSMFFNIIFAGFYRHQALWLVFLISMYWIAGRDDEKDDSGPSTRTTPVIHAIRTSGLVMFMALLALQVVNGLHEVVSTAFHIAPESRSRDLGLLVARSPELRDAIVIADPDYLVEPLSYYVPNRTYLMRERRFGNIVVFTRKAILRLTLDDILTDARNLRTETGKAVVILLTDRLDPSLPAQVIREGYNWELSTTPEQIQRFRASTQLIERFGPVSNSDESFDVYVVD